MTTTFVPPGSGAWELERTHNSRPMSVLMAELFPAAMMRGFSEGTRYYGVLLDHLEVAIINRFCYVAPRAAGAPKSAKGPPPKLLFKLLQHVNPELKRRIKRAEAVFPERAWRKELTRWHDEVKPAIAAEAKTLMAENIAALPTPEFVLHLRQAIDFCGRTIYWHHRFNMCVMVPTGDFVAHTVEWTGLPASEILQTLRGSSPISVGATEELTALRAVILADGESMRLLLSKDDPAAILKRLRASPGLVGPAAAAYLDVVGPRVIGGYDIAYEQAQEHPELLLKILRAAVAQDDPDRRSSAEHAVAKVRDRAPVDRHEMFDDLLREAQTVYGLRDERIFYGDAMGGGVARRAVLEAGTRLRWQGLVNDPTHFVDATLEETVRLIETGSGPSAAELAERVRFRLETSMDSAPAHLGFPPSAPPPAEWLPPAAARLQRALVTMMGLMFAIREEQSQGKTLRGFSASPGTYEGLARVIHSIGELPSIQKGEVLVTRSTGPTFNVVLPLIGAIVTERGGALSHAAIVAREYGLPAVVGCGGATSAILTGARIRVDGGKGEVWILA